MHVSVGDLVQDSLTGLKGIATCRSEWLFGCVRVQVQPQKLDKDGKAPEAVHFDEGQLKVLKKQVFIGIPATATSTGGPREETRRAPDARRVDDDRR